MHIHLLQSAHLQSGRASVLPFGAILTPEPLPGQILPTADGDPLVCSHCEAFACSYCRVDPTTGEWACPFCGNTNEPAARLAFVQEAMDFISPPSTTAMSSAEAEPLRIIALDLASADHHLDSLKTALYEALDSTPDHTKLALIAFGAVASVCRLLPAAIYNDARPDDAIAAHFDVYDPLSTQVSSSSGHLHVAPASQCREQLLHAVESLSHLPFAPGLQRIESVVNAAIRLLKESSGGSNGAGKAAPSLQGMERPRANVAAQLVLVTAAAPRLSPGNDEEREAAEKFAEELASKASGHGIAIDVLTLAESNSTYNYNNNNIVLGSKSDELGNFTTGQNTDEEVAGVASVLGSLAVGSGGLLLPHATLGSAMAANLQQVLTRSVGAQCTVELRCSLGLKVEGVLGPAAPLTHQGKVIAKWFDDVPERLKSRNVSSYLINPPDTQQALTLVLETTNAVAAQRFLYLQAAIAWIRADGAQVHRIVTRRVTAPLTLAQGGKDTVDGVNWSLTAVLFSKLIAGEVLERQAVRSRMQAEIIRRGVVEALQEVAMNLGEADASSKGWFSGPSRYSLPSGSLPLAQAAFFLQRAVTRQGPLGGQDSRELFFSNLLAAPVEVAERMCRPSLHVLLPSVRHAAQGDSLEYGLAGPALELQRAPSVDLALLLSFAAVVDGGTVVYVWLSRGAVSQQRVVQACTEHAQRAACSRVPQADVVIVEQGSHLQKKVLARLTPIAGDSIEMQTRQLSMVSGFTKEEVDAAIEEAMGGENINREEGRKRVTLAGWLMEHDMLLPGSVVG